MLQGTNLRWQWVWGGNGIKAGWWRLSRIATSCEEKQLSSLEEHCQPKDGGMSWRICVYNWMVLKRNQELPENFFLKKRKRRTPGTPPNLVTGRWGPDTCVLLKNPEGESDVQSGLGASSRVLAVTWPWRIWSTVRDGAGNGAKW